MGSKRVMDQDQPTFNIYVSMAMEIPPPKSVLGVFESMWIKMEDVDWDFYGDRRTMKRLLEASDTIATLVKKGYKVVIFCNMGMNRSGLMVAMVLMQLGWPLEKALAKIKARHRCTLSNRSFLEALNYLEIRRRRG
jgi:protein-tyrosine phosphatase